MKQTLLCSLLLVGVLVTGCGVSSNPSVVGPSAVATSTLDAKRTSGMDSVTFAIYGTRDYGYVAGAVVTITSTAGVQTLIASGPHAQVKASIPVADSQVHVNITYPGFCPFDGDVVIDGTRASGIWLWIYPGC